ncbi:cystatin domain-containing protein [Vibrio panuliri]|uniref:2-oxoglutarate dehydrogenase n=1 Tax=Vibrio panuliri TaxID=1381081 RepID=A0A1Q9HBD2_9VIBR|nr:cystatin domain-containing protein [Vibrio panuliri]KAB1457644.1 2-oxoglutarate dehydrogenase [Vibrio panuliri]OLQ86434.1 2-oxoglutarate dehydrogenase [Vibrio panuliri]OLQ87292.1 2-oxoglutarate dehydrogenase [Vibrio panuliri]
MSHKWVAATLAIVALGGCSYNSEPAKPVPAMCHAESMPGGWQDASMTPEVEQAVKTLMDRMNNASPLDEVTRVRTQIVNGVNYAIEVKLDNGQYWHGVVYRNIRGDYLIDSVAQQGKLCP